MSNVINIFLEPGKVFANLKDKPTFWLPLTLALLAAFALTAFYTSRVDMVWSVEHSLETMGVEMSPAQLREIKQNAANPSAGSYAGAVSAPIGMAVVMALYALYYMLAGKVTGNSLSFKQGFSLVAWSGMPSLLGILIAIIGVSTMSPQTGMESLMLTHLDPLLTSLPIDHAWSTFAKNVDLLMFWGLFLAALGWRVWGRTTWAHAITVAALPTATMYGIWALIVLLK